MEEVKTCTRCGEEKPFSEFSKHKLGRNGLRPRCRSCVAVENASYRAKTVEGRAVYNARWKREHPERHRVHNRTWAQRNPEKIEAHRMLRNAIRRGELARPNACEECGRAGRIHAHHSDYSKPLDVTWLCPVCHAGEGVVHPLA